MSVAVALAATEEELRNLLKVDITEENFPAYSQLVVVWQGLVDALKSTQEMEKRLEEVENLLARAVTDSDAFELGRQDERRRILGLVGTLEEKCSTIGHVVALHLCSNINAAGPTVNPLPPEAMRERIRRLEWVLAPFAKYGKALTGGSFTERVYSDNITVHADLRAQQREDQPVTVGDCRRAHEILNEK